MRYQIQLIVDGDYANPYLFTDSGTDLVFATEDEGLDWDCWIEYTIAELEEGIREAREVLFQLIDDDVFFDDAVSAAEATIIIYPF